MFTLLTILLTILLFTNYTADAQVIGNPTKCNFGDDTPWEGPKTALAFNIPAAILGCDSPGCIVEITYYEREISWGYEAIVEKIKLSGTCGYDCYNNVYKTALWMLAIINQDRMELDEVDKCYDNFTFRMSTCWQVNINPLSFFEYVACTERECCVSTYRICLRAGTINSPNIEIIRTGVSSPISNDCLLPCEFKNCDDTSPNFIWGPTKQNDGSGFVFYSKQNVGNNIADGNIVISPNIVDNDLNVSISNFQTGLYNLKVYDNIGNRYISTNLQIQAEAGSVTMNFDLTDMPNGNYNLIIYNNEGFLQNKSFIIIR